MKLASRLRRLERLASSLNAAPYTSYVGYKDDPVGYARDILGVILTPDQERICQLLLTPPFKVLVLASTNVGKSFLAAVLVCWWYDCFRPGICLTTAPKLEQVRDILWREIRVLRQAADLGGFPGPKALRLQDSPDHFAAGMVAREGTRFQGRHSRHVLIVFDECVGVDSEFWDRSLPMLQGDRYACLAIGNPTDLSSRAYAEARSGGWHVVGMSALDHPNIVAEAKGEPAPYPSAVRLATLDEMIAKWCTVVPPGDNKQGDIEWPLDSGRHVRPGPEAEALLLGRWPSMASNSVWSEQVFDQACGLKLPPGGPVQLGVDVARFGRDFTCIHAQQNGTSIHHEAHNGWSTSQTAARLRSLAEQLKASGQDPRKVPIAIDDSGVGGGVVDQAQGFLFVPVNAASASPDPRYPRYRDCLWFGVANAAAEKRVSFARLSPGIQQELRRQAIGVQYTLDPSARRVVESKEKMKERIGRSPDDMDALNLAYCNVRG